MSTTDILMVLATALSPLIAVQVTRYLDDQNEVQGRKLQIFKTLMATRAYTLASAHVEALNKIDLEFSTKLPQEKAVLDVWQEYLDHLGDKSLEIQAWKISESISWSICCLQWAKHSGTTSTRHKSRTAHTPPWRTGASNRSKSAFDK